MFYFNILYSKHLGSLRLYCKHRQVPHLDELAWERLNLGCFTLVCF